MEFGREQFLGEHRHAVSLGSKGRGRRAEKGVTQFLPKLAPFVLVLPLLALLAFLCSLDTYGLWPGRFCILWLWRRGIDSSAGCKLFKLFGLV